MNPENVPASYQGDDLNVRNILRVAVIFVFGILFSLVVLALLFQHFEHIYPHRTSEAAPRVTASELPPLPRPQVTPLLDLEAVQALEDQHLTRYAWLTPQQTTAQIPIDRAMILWVQTQSTPPATPTTELEIRQNKAKETPHVP